MRPKYQESYFVLNVWIYVVESAVGNVTRVSGHISSIIANEQTDPMHCKLLFRCVSRIFTSQRFEFVLICI